MEEASKNQQVGGENGDIIYRKPDNTTRANQKEVNSNEKCNRF